MYTWTFVPSYPWNPRSKWFLLNLYARWYYKYYLYCLWFMFILHFNDYSPTRCIGCRSIHKWWPLWMPRSPEWSGDMSKNGMTIGSIIVKFRQCSWGSVTCETKSWSSFHTLSENMSGLGISVTCLCDKPLWGPFIIYCQINKRYFGSQKILLHLKKKEACVKGVKKLPPHSQNGFLWKCSPPWSC